MFKFLKNKIKDAVSKFSKSAQKEEVEEEVEQQVEEQIEQPVEQPVKEDKKPKVTKKSKSKPEAKEDIVEEVEPVEDSSNKQEEQEQSEPEVSKEDDSKVEELTELETPQEHSEEESSKEIALHDEEGEEVQTEPEPQVQEDEDQSEDELEHKLADEAKQDDVEEELQEDIEESTELAEIESIEPEEIQEPKKKGFFSKLFKKKEKEDLGKDVDTVKSEEDIKDETSKEVFESQEVEEVKDVPLDEKTEDLFEDDQKEHDIQQTKEKLTEVVEDDVEEVQEQKEVVNKASFLDEDVTDATKKKKGFFGKIKEKFVKFKLTEEAFDELFWEFELALMENNVAVEVIEKIKSDLHEKLTQEQVSKSGIEQTIMNTLKESIDEILSIESFDLLKKTETKKPFVICIVGVNGSGKTTTIGKLIHYFKQNNKSIVVAASDTFRAAAIQQLEEHTTRLDVKLIKQDYHADPAAVAFDAIKHATAKNIDIVLIDTAGRLQSNSNLMDELKKLIRVNKPDLNLFIGESITGNDCVEQAVAFNDAVGIDGLILSKADVDEKGGAALSVSYVTKKPILFFGMGQTYDDLKPYDKEEVLQNLGFE